MPSYRNPIERSRGFTLIELMVTVAIASILLTVATSAYKSQIRKSRRTEAKTALLDLAGREERLYATTSQYGNTQAQLGYGTSTSAFTSVAVGTGYYQVSITNVSATANPPTYTLTATPVTGKGQENDTQCASFTVDQTGTQSSLDSSGNNSTSTCWQS